jgi:hypothetical protein
MLRSERWTSQFEPPALISRTNRPEIHGDAPFGPSTEAEAGGVQW